jgi:phosphoglycerate dehydrogenase-like enzyme
VDTNFRVTLSSDFCDETGRLIFPDIGLSLLDNVPHLSYRFLTGSYAEYSPEQLRDCDVLISLKPKITAASLAGIQRLCAIGRCGVGYDNVDLASATEHDVAVFITPGGVVRPVGEAIVLYILALSHNLMSKDRMVRRGQWVESTRRLGREPRDRIVGSIGLGNIASEVVRLLAPFGLAGFLAFDPYVDDARGRALGVRMVSLEELLRTADYLLVNCPLTNETRGLIGEREFGLMKADAVLINTARGGVVRQDALIRALREGRIRGAALDVFEQEPLPSDSPLIEMDNVILSSHSIAWSEELFRDMGRIDCEGALAVRRGEVPASVVNRDVLERPGFQAKLARYKAALAS